MREAAAGEAQIDRVNADYRRRKQECRERLAELGLPDPNPFDDLWAWQGRWQTEFPTADARREYVGEVYAPLAERLRALVLTGERQGPRDGGVPASKWTRVDRGLDKMVEALGNAKHTEDYQAVGFYGREVLISLAETVHDPTRHPSLDSVGPSNTDARRRLEAFIEVELQGGGNTSVRRHARLTIELANELTHKRTAEFRLAAHCLEAVRSACEHVAIADGRRDRSPPPGGIAMRGA
jgi:hypothetical protein